MKYTDEYIKDLKEAQNNIPGIQQLKDSSILITGAGGLICSVLVDFLHYLNETVNMGIRIYVGARDEAKINNRFNRLVNGVDFHFFQYDALKEIDADIHFDYIVHGASNANPALYVSQPVETMLAILNGTQKILEYALIHSAKRVLLISSSEIYGKKEERNAYSEQDYNYVDILNPRACYPSAKRAAETLCASYLQEYNVDSVIVRPGHVYGPSATESDNRASSQFPKDVVNGHDIVMKSAGAQLRSYCYVIDCVTAILTVLMNGESGEAYNISNSNSVVSIRQMAEEFAKAGGKQVLYENPSDVEKISYNLMSNSCLTSNKIEDLGWKAVFELKRGVEATLKSI